MVNSSTQAGQGVLDAQPGVSARYILTTATLIFGKLVNSLGFLDGLLGNIPGLGVKVAVCFSDRSPLGFSLTDWLPFGQFFT